MPSKALFFSCCRGVSCMVAGGMRLRMLRRSGRLLTAKPSFFPGSESHFLKFRRLYRERASGFYSGPALRKTGAISSSPFALGDVCAGFGGG